MSKSIIVPEDLYNKAVETAARDHVSVKSSSPSRSRIASPAGSTSSRAPSCSAGMSFERALAEIPDVEPEVHDRL